MHFCRACYTTARKGKELQLGKRRSYCKNNRKEIKNTTLGYLNIIEENPKAFDYMEKESQVDYFRDRLSFLKEKKGIKQENS